MLLKYVGLLKTRSIRDLRNHIVLWFLILQLTLLKIWCAQTDSGTNVVSINACLLIGLGKIMVLRYTRVLKNPDFMIFNTDKNSVSPLSIKLIVCSEQHSPPEVSLYSTLVEQAAGGCGDNITLL